MKEKLLLFLFFLLIILVVNFGLWNVFFQQDEWYWFGQAILTQKQGVQSLFQLAGFHFNPLYSLSFYLFYKFFHFQWQPYAFYSITLQAINTFLLFFLVKKVTKNTYSSFLSSCFFLVANTSQQAVTWYAASLNVLPAAMFGLLSLLSFYEYYVKKKGKYLIFSVIFLIVGLGFKEDILFLFLIYPLSLLFVKKIQNKKYTLLISVLGLIYMASRVVIQKFGTQNPLSHINTVTYFMTIIENMILIPLKSFSQLYFSPLMVYNLGHVITRGHEDFFLLFSPINNIDIFIETVFFNVVTISATVLFFVLIGLIIFISKEKNIRRTIVLLTLFTIISFSPFFLLPYGFGMESRHYYFPLVGGSALLGYLTVVFWKKHRNKEYKFLLVAALALYFGYNYLLDRQQLDLVIDLSKPRIAFVQQVQKIYPRILNGSIFLSQGDILPFQSGVGQMLMVIFSDNYQFNSLLSSNVLWDMGSQGYKRKQNETFGYYSDKALVTALYKEKSLSLSAVYAFSWNGKKMILSDISMQTRKELQNNE